MHSVKILLVDDQQAVRNGIRSLLSIRSDSLVVCGEASDGAEAVEKIRSLQPDLVLMDISMPRMNGIEATRIIRRDNPRIDVILVSQNEASVVSRQAADVDAFGYVSKSELSFLLLPMIDSLVKERRASIPGNRTF